MEETENMTDNMADFKTYVLDMIKALDDKIEALNDVVVNQIMKPAIEQYQNERFEDFKGKYGERLGKYNSLLQKSFGDDYDNTREAWNQIQENTKDSEEYDIDGAVNDMERQTLDFVNKIREEMGLAPETALSIESTDGKTEIKADTTGDGETDTTIETIDEETKEIVDPTETETESDEEEVDPELQKELEAYLNN